eukprot:TRINITY_DN646_c0_g3_i1.p1 TRINITY_DN646_c0_g3~~TRINITY_DN646_c0_g3_i1.p1  ORF type:complete len:536 (+),score=127.04 TRINITY_DN646_c0_g3_i1:86-1693(+)
MAASAVYLPGRSFGRRKNSSGFRRVLIGALACAGVAAWSIRSSSQSFASGLYAARRAVPAMGKTQSSRLGSELILAARGGEAQEFAVGDKVKAKSEDENWYPGVIDKIGDGVFTVKWDDPDGGPETEDVVESAMKKIIVFKDYVVGDDVLATPPEDSNMYPGTVAKVNADGTFQVKWDDPDGGPESHDLQPDSMKKVVIFKDYKVGDIVEAKFPEDGNMYPAEVIKINDDGTFQVKWEDSDGGPETSPCKPKEMKYPPISFDKLEVGQKYKGTVKSVRDFGAFVDIGAEGDGLLHISSIANKRVENIYDYLEDGQVVDVWISGKRDDGKFGLTMIEGKTDRGRPPPADLGTFANLDPNEWHKGTVRTLASYGAFVTVTLEDGTEADGMVHISQIRDGFVDNVEDELSAGQEVQVRVQSVDLERNKISLSMKEPYGGGADGGFRAAREPVDLASFESMPSDKFITGKVVRCAPFGAFVAVKSDEGVEADGLVHITEIRDGFVENVEDELSVDQEVEVRVKSVDNGKLSLSMKREEE